MWIRPSVSGGPAPSARCAHTTATCDNSKLYIYGGWNGQKMLNDLFIFYYGGEAKEMSWSRPVATGNVPVFRAGHTMTAVGHKLLVFGGGDGSHYLNDLHILDTETMVWSQAYVAGTSPAARSRHTANLIGSRLFIFGGGDDTRVFNDVYILDTETMSWSRPAVKGNPPAARWGHTTTLIGDGKLLVFGGHDGTQMLNDIHILDIMTLTWSQPTIPTKNSDNSLALIPSARAGHTTTLVGGNKLLVFGGGDGTKILNDTWIMDLPTLLWTKPSISGNPPSARCAHTLNVVENNLIVFGGGDGNRRMKDVYILQIDEVLKSDEKRGGKSKKVPPKKRSNDASKTPEELLPKDIATFLDDIGMKKYLEKFVEHEIEVDTLPFLTEQHLDQLGITTVGARLRLMHAIKNLSNAMNPKKENEVTDASKDLSELASSLKESIDSLTASTNRLSEILRSSLPNPAQGTSRAPPSQTPGVTQLKMKPELPELLNLGTT